MMRGSLAPKGRGGYRPKTSGGGGSFIRRRGGPPPKSGCAVLVLALAALPALLPLLR